jgi:V8-like Glu-specific endopeptidase
MGRRAIWSLIAVVLMTPPPAHGQAVQTDDPSAAVFQLETVVRDTGRGVAYGTAFFTSADGTALTVSHVVYRAQRDPNRYALMAILNKEFYSVQIVCASRLGYDPRRANAVTGVPLGRDVAQIKVVPSQFTFHDWFITLTTGDRLPMATAHSGPLPGFHYLTLASGPMQGAHIRVIGFGHISPIPRMFVADGRIDKMNTTMDGTDIFSAMFTNPPQAGNSGSPILNERNQVVGIFPWSSLTDSDMATGISSSALQKPCR